MSSTEQLRVVIADDVPMDRHLVRFFLEEEGFRVIGEAAWGDEAVRLYRQLADRPTALVPRPLVLLTLADQLSKSNPSEAAKLYDQIKKDFPDSAVSDEAEKRLENLGPKT